MNDAERIAKLYGGSLKPDNTFSFAMFLLRDRIRRAVLMFVFHHVAPLFPKPIEVKMKYKVMELRVGKEMVETLKQRAKFIRLTQHRSREGRTAG